jgi:hypothetical protein
MNCNPALPEPLPPFLPPASLPAVCAAAKEHTEAFRLYKELRASGVPLDGRVYGALAACAARCIKSLSANRREQLVLLERVFDALGDALADAVFLEAPVWNALLMCAGEAPSTLSCPTPAPQQLEQCHRVMAHISTLVSHSCHSCLHRFYTCPKNLPQQPYTSPTPNQPACVQPRPLCCCVSCQAALGSCSAPLRCWTAWRWPGWPQTASPGPASYRPASWWRSRTWRHVCLSARWRRAAPGAYK